MNSRYELLTRQQFCGDISTLFQSHCQTRINYLQACFHIIYKETGRRNDIAVMLHYTVDKQEEFNIHTFKYTNSNLLFLEALYIKNRKPLLSNGLKASKELAVFS